MLAVLASVGPLTALALRWTTRVKLWLAPAARVGLVQVTVPAAPTAGVVQLKVVVPWLSETKVVPDARVSETLTFWASDLPNLTTPVNYTLSLPDALPISGPVLVIERLALMSTVLEAML